MSKAIRAKWVAVLTAVIMTAGLLSCISVFSGSGSVYADEENSIGTLKTPLDLSEATSDAGDLDSYGWEWFNDTRTLKLKDLNMDITDYEEDYDAAIMLPDGDVTIEVVPGRDPANVPSLIKMKGHITEDDYRLAIFTPGNLTIKGSGILKIEAEGANGIQTGVDQPSSGAGMEVRGVKYIAPPYFASEDAAVLRGSEGEDEAGNLVIKGTDQDPEEAEGLTLDINADQFGMAAVSHVSVSNCKVKSDIANSARLAGYTGCILGQNSAKVKDSELYLSAAGECASGVTSWYGDVTVKDSFVKQTQKVTGTKYADSISCINAWKGDAVISRSIVDANIGTGDEDFVVSVGRSMQVGPVPFHIRINDSAIKGRSKRYGIDALYGDASLTDTILDIVSQDNALYVGGLGPLTITGCSGKLKAHGFVASAINTGAPAAIKDSQLTLVTTGEIGTSLEAPNYQDKGDLVFKGRDTDIIMRSENNGFEIYADRDKTTPVKASLKFYDGLRVVEGGNLQHIDYWGTGDSRSWCYTTGKLRYIKGDGMAGMSKNIRIRFAKNQETAAKAYAAKASAKISWTKVPDAVGYKAYFAEYGKTLKKVKTTGAGNLSFTKKNLKKNLVYRFRVDAQKHDNGNYWPFSKSKIGYFVTTANSRYTNPKSITLSEASFTLSKAEAARIKANVTKAAPKKALLGKKYGPKLRYTSSDPTVASVDASGKITAKDRTGTCKIYVQAINGLWKTVTVKVK